MFGIFDNGSLNPNYGKNINNNNGLAWDLVNHNTVAFFYSIVTAAITLTPFFYVEFIFNAGAFPDWVQQFS